MGVGPQTEPGKQKSTRFMAKVNKNNVHSFFFSSGPVSFLMMVLWVFLGLFVLADCAPYKVEKKSGHFPVGEGATVGAGVPRVRALSRISSSSRIIKEENGERNGMEKQDEEVSLNGELVSKLLHKEEAEQSKGGAPQTKGMTEFEVPALNIHQRLYNSDGHVQVGDAPPVKRHASPAIGHVLMEQKGQEPQNTLEELAGYILETGDQASVVEFIQLLLEEGKVRVKLGVRESTNTTFQYQNITQEEALEYIDAIKRMLEEAEGGREEREEEPMDDIEKIRELVRQGKQQEEEDRKVKAITDIMENVSTEEAGESDTFLRINDYLERGLKGGKLSKNTYNLLKEALIKSVLDKIGIEEAPVDYSNNS